MKIRTWATTASLAFCLMTLPLVAAPHDSKTKKKVPDEQAMMDAWMKAATPGPAHKALEPFVGTFAVNTRAWMAPGAPPMESTGVSENTWALGGRYVEQRFTGTFMGAPFEGVGYTGYDNVGKKYVGSWIDNMSTGMMTSEGWLEKDGKTFTFNGSMLDPMTGKATKIKEKITVNDNDNHVFEMWNPGPDGKMFKSMEIVYTRK